MQFFLAVYYVDLVTETEQPGRRLSLIEEINRLLDPVRNNVCQRHGLALSRCTYNYNLFR
jgi:hypothetical protein